MVIHRPRWLVAALVAASGVMAAACGSEPSGVVLNGSPLRCPEGWKVEVTSFTPSPDAIRSSAEEALARAFDHPVAGPRLQAADAGSRDRVEEVELGVYAKPDRSLVIYTEETTNGWALTGVESCYAPAGQS